MTYQIRTLILAQIYFNFTTVTLDIFFTPLECEDKLHMKLFPAEFSPKSHNERAVLVLLVIVVAVLDELGVRDKFEVREESGKVMMCLLELHLKNSQMLNPRSVTP